MEDLEKRKVRKREYRLYPGPMFMRAGPIYSIIYKNCCKFSHLLGISSSINELTFHPALIYIGPVLSHILGRTVLLMLHIGPNRTFSPIVALDMLFDLGIDRVPGYV
jgi:hypothetical protein